MVITALQSIAHTRERISAILNICVSPAITADNRATLYGIVHTTSSSDLL